MWQRNKEIFVGDEKIGYITLYWDKEKDPLFYADIELAFINRLANIKQDKGLIKGFTLEYPVFKISAQSSTELDEKIKIQLDETIGSVYELKYR